MVTLVYFGADLSKALGDTLPLVRADNPEQWVLQGELLEILNEGRDVVTIRPATFAEYLQVEAALVQVRVENGVREILRQASSAAGTPECS